MNLFLSIAAICHFLMKNTVRCEMGCFPSNNVSVSPDRFRFSFEHDCEKLNRFLAAPASEGS